ncbi:hypothetical protein WG904_05090 [Pedobacter sp. Du54]|uniref:hypothetical protein n=1 Tax=Pedobacter anseongensis TaxID=3133439 RepID=UPI0030AB36EE
MNKINFLLQNTVLIKLCFLFVLMSISFSTRAQIGRGCYVGGVLYTANTAKGNKYFYRTSGVKTTPCEFVRTGNQAHCRLYNGGNINNNASYTKYLNAFSNDWDEVICPLDQYVWVLLASFSTISFFRLRAANMVAN